MERKPAGDIRDSVRAVKALGFCGLPAAASWVLMKTGTPEPQMDSILAAAAAAAPAS